MRLADLFVPQRITRDRLRNPRRSHRDWRVRRADRRLGTAHPRQLGTNRGSCRCTGFMGGSDRGDRRLKAVNRRYDRRGRFGLGSLSNP